jgi:hypothetical protein
MKENQPKCPNQVHLFQQVATMFSSRTVAIEDYKHRFNCGSSTARAHFAGTNAITYEHYIQVVRAYNLEDKCCFNGKSPSGRVFSTARQLSPLTDMSEYLSVFEQDLAQCAERNGSHLYMVLGHVPFFMLKRYRNLAAFYLYDVLKENWQWPQNLKPRFHRDFLRVPKISQWLDRCRHVLQHYQQIPGTEYWSPRMFEHLLMRIRNAAVQEGTFDRYLLEQIFDDLHQLINALEHHAEQGTKLPGYDGKGAKLKVFVYTDAFSENILVAQSNGTDFLYVEHGFRQLLRYRDQVTANDQYNLMYRHYFESQLTHTPVTNDNFFDPLRQQVEGVYGQLSEAGLVG